jgi:hypothetical protein
MKTNNFYVKYNNIYEVVYYKNLITSIDIRKDIDRFSVQTRTIINKIIGRDLNTVLVFIDRAQTRDAFSVK